jgi:hypothetical protein
MPYTDPAAERARLLVELARLERELDTRNHDDVHARAEHLSQLDAIRKQIREFQRDHRSPVR